MSHPDPFPIHSVYPALPPPVAVELTLLGEHDCNYLPGRPAQSRAVRANRIDPRLYHEFMNANFRRSGDVLYQPVCRSCRACVAVRVPVAEFVASKSQRRVWGKNQDLLVGVGIPEPGDEKFDLYRRYLVDRHDGSMNADDRDGFEAFLYRSPVDTLEFTYRTAEGKLIAVGICDVCDQSLSSVYFYFDPDESRRSPGIFGALYELEFCRRHAVPMYYLGYWVAGCRTMEYKTRFTPTEYLSGDGVWRRELEGLRDERVSSNHTHAAPGSADQVDGT